MDILQFTLKSDTSRFLAYNNYYCHNTSRSFELIFMKFAWLVGVHTLVNPTFFFFFNRNNQSNRTTGENVPLKLVFGLSFSRYGVFWGKDFKAVFGTLFIEKVILFIFVVWHSIPWKMVMPPKNYFLQLFWKILFFLFLLKKLLYEKYSKSHFLQKSLYWFLLPDTPFPTKWSFPPQRIFRNFFNKNWRTSARFCCSKVYSFERKFYGE